MLATVSGRGHAWVMLLRSGCLGMGLGACQIVPGFSLLRYHSLQGGGKEWGFSLLSRSRSPGLRASSDSGPACLCL